MAWTRGKIVHLVFGVLFFVLATLAFVLYAILAGDFFTALQASKEPVDGFNSNALGAGIALVIMIVCVGFVFVLDLISLVLSVLMIRRSDRPLKIYGAVSCAISALYAVFTVALTVVAYLGHAG